MGNHETFRQADHIALPVPEGTRAGTPVRVGALNAVTATDRANTAQPPIGADGTPNLAYNPGGGNRDGEASCWLAGGYTLPITSGDGINPGDPVYWVGDGQPLADTDTGGGGLFGHAITEGTSNGDGTYSAVVRITN